MKIWELQDASGGSICFEPTKAEAEKTRKIMEDANNPITIRAIYVKPTRKGIAEILTAYGGGAG